MRNQFQIKLDLLENIKKVDDNIRSTASIPVIANESENPYGPQKETPLVEPLRSRSNVQNLQSSRNLDSGRISNSTEMFSHMETNRKYNQPYMQINKQSQSQFDKTTEIGSEDSRLVGQRFASNYSERNIKQNSFLPPISSFQAIPEEKVMNKDLMILEGQLKNQM